jgi:hypothetical protein
MLIENLVIFVRLVVSSSEKHTFYSCIALIWPQKMNMSSNKYG